jgi:class 3 adenylate cyclase
VHAYPWACPFVRSAARRTLGTVTVVFSDVTGSTSLGERLDAEALRRVMSRYFDEMESVIERDAVMAVFGIPQLHEDDALRAVRAAAAMRERLAVLNDQLEQDRAYGSRFARVSTRVSSSRVTFRLGRSSSPETR